MLEVRSTATLAGLHGLAAVGALVDACWLCWRRWLGTPLSLTQQLLVLAGGLGLGRPDVLLEAGG